jgi:hypothetical protein
MKKSTKRTIFIPCGIILAVLIVAVALFFRELQSLASLKAADSYPFYTMTYAGDYGFDEFLKTGARNDREIESFVVKRLLKGVNIDLHISGGGCTAFAAADPSGSMIYGRNFDFDYAPSMLLKTKPKVGYASISIVNLAFAGYDKSYLPEPLHINSFLTLAAPFLPFDGMNEKGVVISLLAVPRAEAPQKPGQVTLNTTTAIRLVLDKAASVDEAVALLKKYNYYFSGDIACHYLIADRSGKSVLVEFLDGDIKVTERSGNYQVASNFIAYNGMNEGEGGSEFKRYDTVFNKLKETNGVLDRKESMILLSQAAMPGKCQWSVVYDLHDMSVDVCVGDKYDRVYSYTLD